MYDDTGWWRYRNKNTRQREKFWVYMQYFHWKPLITGTIVNLRYTKIDDITSAMVDLDEGNQKKVISKWARNVCTTQCMFWSMATISWHTSVWDTGLGWHNLTSIMGHYMTHILDTWSVDTQTNTGLLIQYWWVMIHSHTFAYNQSACDF